MKVTYLDHMGNELTVVNAARVSFAKKSDWGIRNYSGKDEIWQRAAMKRCLSEKDKKLIKYLAKHNHWSPFSHPQISLHIKAPIFVARQLAKHQVGFAWNEVSRRYVDSEPEFYLPTEWRLKAENKKQGSSDNISSNNEYYQEYAERIKEFCLQAYEQMLCDNICPEQARMILPQNTYTEWYWTGSLYGFARVYNLRAAPDAQKECQEIAKQISNIIAPLFPESWKVLTTGEIVNEN